jgi:hypothetical protein
VNLEYIYTDVRIGDRIAFLDIGETFEGPPTDFPIHGTTPHGVGEDDHPNLRLRRDDEVAAVADGFAVMVDRQAAVRIPDEPVESHIEQRISVHDRRVQPLEAGTFEQSLAGRRLAGQLEPAPREEIFSRCDQTPSGKIHPSELPARIPPEVSYHHLELTQDQVRRCDPMGDDVVGRETRMVHPEWREEPLADEGGIRLPRDPFDDVADDRERGVVVGESLSWIEQSSCSLERLERVGHLLAEEVVAVEARPMTEEVLDRDGLGVETCGRCESGQMLTNRVFEREMTLLDEEHHRGRRERLRDRADLEVRLLVDRQGVLDIGDPARGEERLIADEDTSHSSGHAEPRYGVIETSS